MEFNTRSHKIGDWVIVYATARTEANREERLAANSARRVVIRRVLLPPRVGQVVGIGRLPEGMAMYRVRGDEGTFIQERNRYCWLVRFGASNKPECVLAKDLLPAAMCPHRKMPARLPFNANPYKWTGAERELLRIEAEGKPRSPDGRFVVRGGQ